MISAYDHAAKWTRVEMHNKPVLGVYSLEFSGANMLNMFLES